MQNITPIEMLPELDDLEKGNINKDAKDVNNPSYSGAMMLPPAERDKFGRYIRGNHAFSPESGMRPTSNFMYQQQPPQPQQPQQQLPQVPMPEQYQQQYQRQYQQQYEPYQAQQPQQVYDVSSPSCIDVANHIASCPICSKFYNNDKTVYIIAIILLSILCVLLLKKVLDV